MSRVPLALLLLVLAGCGNTSGQLAESAPATPTPGFLVVNGDNIVPRSIAATVVQAVVDCGGDVRVVSTTREVCSFPLSPTLEFTFGLATDQVWCAEDKILAAPPTPTPGAS
jgi:hypothetical protein